MGLRWPNESRMVSGKSVSKGGGVPRVCRRGLSGGSRELRCLPELRGVSEPSGFSQGKSELSAPNFRET